jgi:hypothetical protein
MHDRNIHVPACVLRVHRCCVQFHPDSRHPLRACLLRARGSSHLRATECRLVGPKPGSSSITEYGVATDFDATVSLVSELPPRILHQHETMSCSPDMVLPHVTSNASQRTLAKI